MAISVRLTLRRLHGEQGGVDRGTESFDAFDIGAEMSDHVAFDLRFSIVARHLKGGGKREGDDAVKTTEVGRSVEKDHRRTADVATVHDSRGRFGLVDHVMHSVQGKMRVGVMPPVQAYGVMGSLPSLQGKFR